MTPLTFSSPPSQVESLVGLLTQLSTLVASNGGMKPKQWGKVVALLAKDAAKVGEGRAEGVAE